MWSQIGSDVTITVREFFLLSEIKRAMEEWGAGPGETWQCVMIQSLFWPSQLSRLRHALPTTVSHRQSRFLGTQCLVSTLSYVCCVQLYIHRGTSPKIVPNRCARFAHLTFDIFANLHNLRNSHFDGTFRDLLITLAISWDPMLKMFSMLTMLIKLTMWTMLTMLNVDNVGSVDNIGNVNEIM